MNIIKSIGATLNKINPFSGTSKAFSNSYTHGYSGNYVNNGIASWSSLSTSLALLNCYNKNPIANAVINIRAIAKSNMRYDVKDLGTGEIIPLDEYIKDGGKLKDLLARPNPLQSNKEWVKQHSVNSDVFGNGYSYASVPTGFENSFTYKEINVLNNLPPYLISPVLTGKWLDQTELTEIISQYELRSLNGIIRKFNPNVILHTNNVNIEFDQNFTRGVSKLIALEKPLSNIDIAYEAINVLSKNKGALGMITSDAKDGTAGSIPLHDSDIEQVQDAWKKYGMTEGQYSFFISKQPLKFQKMSIPMKDMLLYEQISTSGVAVCNAYGVPESLVRYYIKKGSLGTDSNVDEKRFYDSTIIPESNEDMISLNNFFKTKDLGIELIGTFDHLKVLQKNQKEEATTNKINEARAMSAFKIGSITYGTYLQESNLPPNDKIADKTIFDLTDEERQIIGITVNTEKITEE